MKRCNNQLKIERFQYVRQTNNVFQALIQLYSGVVIQNPFGGGDSGSSLLSSINPFGGSSSDSSSIGSSLLSSINPFGGSSSGSSSIGSSLLSSINPFGGSSSGSSSIGSSLLSSINPFGGSSSGSSSIGSSLLSSINPFGGSSSGSGLLSSLNPFSQTTAAPGASKNSKANPIFKAQDYKIIKIVKMYQRLVFLTYYLVVSFDLPLGYYNQMIKEQLTSDLEYTQHKKRPPIHAIRKHFLMEVYLVNNFSRTKDSNSEFQPFNPDVQSVQPSEYSFHYQETTMMTHLILNKTLFFFTRFPHIFLFIFNICIINQRNHMAIDLSNSDYLLQQEIVCQEINPLWIILGILFGFGIIRFFVLLIITIIKQLMPLQARLKKYCKEDGSSWAVVTGATDGVGLGFVQVLVTLGFNVVLISRNSQKLQKTVQHLQTTRPEKYKDRKLKAITFNFQDSADEKKLSIMLDQLKDLDICLLINNVGTSFAQNYHNVKEQDIIDIITINCTSMAVLTSEMLKIMVKRSKKSGIVNISSYMGEKAIPFLTLYASTKSFNKQFSNSLALEYPNIDILSLKPMFVQSPLSQQKKGFNIPDRRQCAYDSLKELLIQSESYGYYSHRIVAFIIRTFVPDFLYPLVVNRFLKRAIKKLFPHLIM